MHKNLKIIINKEITFNKKIEITKKANKTFLKANKIGKKKRNIKNLQILIYK